jgi:REP element-mobilizing transposase RayT
MEHHGFGAKLHHEIPPWVESGARFHIRIRCHQDSPTPLTSPEVAQGIMKSAIFYETKLIWYVALLLLMPDHLHAILSFAPGRTMSRAIGDWKRYATRSFGVIWQENYFDHRLRDEDQFSLKYHYILQNPIAAGLCKDPSKWPWWISETRR